MPRQDKRSFGSCNLDEIGYASASHHSKSSSHGAGGTARQGATPCARDRVRRRPLSLTYGREEPELRPSRSAISRPHTTVSLPSSTRRAFVTSSDQHDGLLARRAAPFSDRYDSRNRPVVKTPRGLLISRRIRGKTTRRSLDFRTTTLPFR